MQDIKTVIKKSGLFKKINIGSDFNISKNALPLCIIMPGPGEIEHLVIGSMEAHIIGLLHENRDLEKKRTELMKETMAAMSESSIYKTGNVRLSFDAEALSVFGIMVPVMAPYGAFRLTYDIEFSLQREF